MATAPVKLFRGGNGVGNWQANVINGNFDFDPNPGTRLQLTEIKNGSTFQYFEVKGYGKSVISKYKPLPFGQYNGNSVLFEERDARGQNYITYDYDNDGRLTTVTDSAGRSYVIEYQNEQYTQNERVAKVTLYLPNESPLEWIFITPDEWLGEIQFPDPDSGATSSSTPSIEIWYHGYSQGGNILRIRDMKGYFWDYAYGQEYVHQGLRLEKYWKADRNNTGTLYSQPTVFEYDKDFNGTYIETFVKEPYGAYGDTTPPIRTKSYYFVIDEGNPLTIPYWIDTEWVTNSSTFYEKFIWDTTQGDLTDYYNQEGHHWEFEYSLIDDSGLVTYEVGPNGNATSYWYESWMLTKSLSQEGRITEFYYNGSSGPYLTVGSTGDVIREERDSVFGGLYHKTYHEYGDSRFGTPTKTYLFGESSMSPTVTFDALGLPATSTDGASNQTIFDYDWRGNLLLVTEPTPGGTTTHEYDYWGRRIKTFHPGGVDFVQMAYDLNGNLESTVDEAGTIVITSFNGWDLMNSSSNLMEDPNPSDDRTISYTYDVVGNQVSITNAENEQTTNTFDVRDRVTQIDYPYTGSSSTTTVLKYEYYVDNLLKKFTNGRGQTANYTYSNRNLVYQIDYQGSGVLANDVTFGFDGDGLRTSMLSFGGTQTWVFDKLGRLRKHYQPYSGRSVVHNYYSTNGRRQSTLVTLGDSYTAAEQTWTYFYDNTRRLLEKITQQEGDSELARFEYYPNGALKKTETTEVGVFPIRESLHEYSDRGFTTAVMHTLIGLAPMPDKILNWMEYQYDTRGNMSAYSNSFTQHAEYPGFSWGIYNFNYVYNRANELTLEETEPGGINPSAWDLSNAFEYDKAGNRTGQTTDGVTYGYIYDDDDRLISRTSSGSDHIYYNSYDKDGNPGAIIYSGLRNLTLSYNSRSEVTQINFSDSNGSSYFKYDGNGRRIERKEQAAGESQTTTRYVYDGETIIAEVDGSNAATMFIVPGIGYVKSDGAAVPPPGGGPLSPDGSRVMIGGGTFTQYYILSGNGSTVKIIDSSNNVLAVQDSSAFGTPHSWWTIEEDIDRSFKGDHSYIEDNQNGSRFFFIGRRFYSYDTGSFVTQDPIGHDGGLNLYRYTKNNPLTWIDPTGTRELTSADISRLQSIYKTHASSAFPGVTMKAINAAVREIKSAIAAVPQGQQDPVNLKALWNALDELGDTSWSVGAAWPGNKTLSPVKTGSPKCNAFVAATYGKVVGYGTMYGYPTRGRVNTTGVSANVLGNFQRMVGNLLSVSTPQPGYIFGLALEGSSGHSGLYLGAGLLIYAGPTRAKIGTLEVNQAGHKPVVWRKFLSGRGG